LARAALEVGFGRARSEAGGDVAEGRGRETKSKRERLRRTSAVAPAAVFNST
jgi:hypothetical protein